MPVTNFKGPRATIIARVILMEPVTGVVLTAGDLIHVN